jgi:hypothetical protein
MNLIAPNTKDRDLNSFLYSLGATVEGILAILNQTTYTGTFTTADGKTVTVSKGIITKVV